MEAKKAVEKKAVEKKAVEKKKAMRAETGEAMWAAMAGTASAPR